MPENVVENEEKGVTNEENGKDKVKDINEEETEEESAIIRQVEYYFGDMNLPRDKFLREQIKLDEGWVPIDVLITFNRLAKLSTDTSIIANALNKSTSGILEMSEDNKKVRRNPELPLPEMNEERRKELMSRSVYVKGFPKDSSLDDLIKYFKDHPEAENILMRKYVDRTTKKKLFKGSVFVIFKTKEQAEKFVGTKGLKHGDTDLIILWQDDYLQKKQAEYVTRKEKKSEKKSEKQKEKNKHKGEQKDETIKLPTGTVLHFSECSEKLTRENMKDAIGELGGETAYIDFQVGNKEGWVRLNKENAAKEFFEKITEGKLKIDESEVVFRVLEGDEEKKYLDKTVEEMTKRRNNSFNKYKKGFKQYKGSSKGHRKRKQEAHRDAPPEKVKAD